MILLRIFSFFVNIYHKIVCRSSFVIFWLEKRKKKCGQKQANKTSLTLSWRRPLSYRLQSTNLGSKSMDKFLYDNGLRHERVKCASHSNSDQKNSVKKIRKKKWLICGTSKIENCINFSSFSRIPILLPRK